MTDHTSRIIKVRSGESSVRDSHGSEDVSYDGIPGLQTKLSEAWKNAPL
ncbi:MAG: hypothetical protein WC982_09775 [Advenella sp.]